MPLGPLTEHASVWRRLGAWLRAIPLTVILFASLIGCNVAQTMSLVVRPFSARTFRAINRWIAGAWWGACVIAAERLNGTRLVVSGSEVPQRENAVVVANHQQMPDITVVMAFARSKRRLGDLKFFVKKAIKWVPGIGWGMQFIDCPFVHRNWNTDRESISRTFDKIVSNRIPLWLVSFVEGTRITPEKLRRSQEFARQRGLQLTRHVLLPRTKGFSATISGLESHLQAVYDLTIAYVDGVPTLWQYIKGSTKRIHVHVRRFPIDELPRGEEPLSDWLIARFYEKDALLEHFYREGSFPAAGAGSVAPELLAPSSLTGSG